jgi:hypothetical protein
MSQHRGLLTPEERARIMQLQDLLIDCFVEHREATAAGQEERVEIVEAEIDGLLAEKAKIEKWAAVARPSRPTEAIGYPITPQTRRNEPSTSATRHWPDMDGKYTG